MATLDTGSRLIVEEETPTSFTNLRLPASTRFTAPWLHHIAGAALALRNMRPLPLVALAPLGLLPACAPIQNQDVSQGDPELVYKFFSDIQFQGASVTQGVLNPEPLAERFFRHMAHLDPSMLTFPATGLKPKIFVGVDFFYPTAFRELTYIALEDEAAIRDATSLRLHLLDLGQSYDACFIGLEPLFLPAPWSYVVDDPDMTQKMEIVNSELQRIAQDPSDPMASRIVLLDFSQLQRPAGRIASLTHPDRSYIWPAVFWIDHLHINSVGQAVMLNFVILALNERFGYQIPLMEETGVVF